MCDGRQAGGGDGLAMKREKGDYNAAGTNPRSRGGRNRGVTGTDGANYWWRRATPFCPADVQSRCGLSEMLHDLTSLARTLCSSPDRRAGSPAPRRARLFESVWRLPVQSCRQALFAVSLHGMGGQRDDGDVGPFSDSRARMRRVASYPSISGIWMSIRMQSKWSWRHAASAAAPLPTRVTRWPRF